MLTVWQATAEFAANSAPAQQERLWQLQAHWQHHCRAPLPLAAAYVALQLVQNSSWLVSGLVSQGRIMLCFRVISMTYLNTCFYWTAHQHQFFTRHHQLHHHMTCAVEVHGSCTSTICSCTSASSLQHRDVRVCYFNAAFSLTSNVFQIETVHTIK